MFEQCIAYRVAIIMCYSCQIEALTSRIPFAQSWAIAKTIYDVMSPIIIACVINQHTSYCLLFDSLVSAIRLYVQLSKDKLILYMKWTCALG